MTDTLPAYVRLPGQRRGITETGDTRQASRTFDAFHFSRAKWTEVGTVEVAPDQFDVVLRIDGTYKTRAQAEKAAKALQAELCNLFDEAAGRHYPPKGSGAPAPPTGPARLRLVAGGDGR